MYDQSQKNTFFFVELEMGPRKQFFFGLYPSPKDTADHSLVTDSRKTFVCAHKWTHVPQLVCGEDNLFESVLSVTR